MIHTSLRSGGGADRKCSRCERPWEIEVKGTPLCEGCLTEAVCAPAPRPGSEYEIRLLENEITRLTGHTVRNLKHLPPEVIRDLRQAVRRVDEEKHSIKSKLRRFGLPG